MTAKLKKYISLQNKVDTLNLDIVKYEASLTAVRYNNDIRVKKRILLDRMQSLLNSFNQKDIYYYENYFQTSFNE